MSAAKKSSQVPKIKELISIVDAYNVARAHELQMMPQGGFPPTYAETDAAKMMNTFFDCAALALKQLKPVLEANLDIGTRV